MANLSELKPDKRNARRHTPRNQGMIEHSIQTNGFGRSVLLASDGSIIAGNATIDAATSAGLDDVLIVESDGTRVIAVKRTDVAPGSERFHALAIADNRAAELAEWDATVLEELSGEIDLSAFFFDEELQSILDGDVTITEGLTDPDDVPDVPAEPTTKPGDLWLLGRHRLLCGDSTVVTDVDRLMGGEKADMVFTDPPYGMDHDPAMSARLMPKGNWINDAKHYDRVIGDDQSFDPGFLLTLFAYCDEIFLWGADYYAESIQGRNTGSWIAWDKREGLEDVDWSTSEFELCWSKQRHQRRIARFRWMGLAGTEQEFDKKRVHPTQKPVALVRWFIEQWGALDDVVVDLFGGSGSTLLACEQTNRACRMMELDAKYCDVIVRRWEQFTGNAATLEAVT